ncbi:MAG: ATP-binding cassette domain-containing protein [Alphaproteobacteria bacterium]|nr:ATP-binding cassette domain-containing protein [Alphaproteobacteria bacterium SS10]
MVKVTTEDGLVLDAVKIWLQDKAIVDLSLTVPAGEVTTVMGPSGAGKSTLLHLICGTLGAPFRFDGRVYLNGRHLCPLPPQRRQVGILFQDDLLFPHMSVGGNLAFALPTGVRGRQARRQRIEDALEAAGLAGMANRDPATLSGGQRARVAVMRVLLSAPQILLLDEPFSKLDSETRGLFRDFVFTQAREQGLPTLMVTHDRTDADAAGGPVVEI